MPIDASIPLSVRGAGPLINPMEVMQGIQSMRSQREQTEALAEQRRALAEQTRLKTVEAQRAQAEELRLRSVYVEFAKLGQDPPLASLSGVVGPERAQKLYDGHVAMKERAVKSLGDAQDRIARGIGAAEALPEGELRTKVYQGVLDNAVSNGWMTQEEALPYSPEAMKFYTARGMSAEKQYEIGHPKPSLHNANPGDVVLDANNPKAGPVYTAPPKTPEPSPALREYTDAKAQGFAGTFEQYQDKEANRHRPVTNINGPGAVKMSDAAVDFAAAQVRIVGNGAGVMTRLNDDDRKRILNRVAEQAQSLGQSPALAVQKQAAYKSDGAALTKMSTMKSAAESYESKAISQADLVKSLSEKVNRSSIPAINGAILSGKTNIAGDENAQLYANALTTFAAEYAKIIEGSTGSAAGSSDSARRAATDLIRVGLTKGQIRKTVDQMQWEMRQTILGYDATISHITERMGGATPAQQQPAPAQGVIYAKDPQGNIHQAAAGTALPAGWQQVAKPGGGL